MKIEKTIKVIILKQYASGLCREQVLLLIKKMHFIVHFVFRSRLVYSLAMTLLNKKTKMIGIE